MIVLGVSSILTREPFGKSMFEKYYEKGKEMPPITFKQLKEYYDNDPILKEMQIIAQESMKNYTWQQQVYAEVFHQVMLFDNIIDLDKIKKIVKDGLKEKK